MWVPLLHLHHPHMQHIEWFPLLIFWESGVWEGRQCRSRLAGHFLVIVWNSEFEQIIAIDFIFIILHKYVFYDPIMANIRKP